MQFSDGLADEGFVSGTAGGGRLGHFFKDVKGGLVALAALGGR